MPKLTLASSNAVVLHQNHVKASARTARHLRLSVLYDAAVTTDAQCSVTAVVLGVVRPGAVLFHSGYAAACGDHRHKPAKVDLPVAWTGKPASWC